MSPGLDIYIALLLSPDRMASLRALSKPALRALLRFIAQHGLDASDAGTAIYGMAHVAATEHFLAKGKGAKP